MNRTYTIVIIVLVSIVVLGGGAYVISKNRSSTTSPSTQPSSSSSNTASPSPSPQPSSSSNSSSSSAQTIDKVAIQNFAFSPASITVKAGTTVTWTNNDSAAHTVTENDNQTGPASGTLNPGSSYTFTYAKAGTYLYHCTFHPSMTGTVTVTQ